MTFELGQTIWIHFYQRSLGVALSPHTVTKIGRKWVTLGNGFRENAYRFDVDTLELDGGDYTSPGKVYLSEEAYHQETALMGAWKVFQDRIRFFGYQTTPKGLTLADIEAASNALKLKP